MITIKKNEANENRRDRITLYSATSSTNIWLATSPAAAKHAIIGLLIALSSYIEEVIYLPQ